MEHVSPGQQVPVSKTHPILIIAGVAVTLFALVGIGAIMGWIPTSGARNADSVAAIAPAPAATPAPVLAQAAPAPVPAPVAAAEPKAAPKPVHKPAAKPAP